MREIELGEDRIVLRDEIEQILEREIKEIGTGAMILIPKKWLGKEAYVLVKRG